MTATLTPADAAHYQPSTRSVQLAVQPLAPVITWNAPLGLVWGTALSATQLNATADRAGTLIYDPPLGTILEPGAHALGVTFTPTDTARITAGTASVTIVIDRQMPVVSWATPAPITTATPLSATQLNATASVAGTFAYTPGLGATLSVRSEPVNLNNALPHS